MLALEPGSKTESGEGAVFALDADAFQILRYHDDAKAAAWVRFGLQRKTPDGDEFEAFVRLDNYQYPVDQACVDLGKDAAEVARRLNVLWGSGQRVVALLGAARMGIQGGMELIEPIQKMTKSLTNVAHMTGGIGASPGIVMSSRGRASMCRKRRTSRRW